jgi:hypothetical protein
VTGVALNQQEIMFLYGNEDENYESGGTATAHHSDCLILCVCLPGAYLVLD